MIRSLVSALLWCAAAWLVGLAVRVKPRAPVKRYEADGVRIVELPQEQILVPPSEWAPGLFVHAAFARITGGGARA